MNNRSSGSGIYAVNECLIVPIGNNMDEAGLKNIGKEVLRRLHTISSRGVLIDVSSISIMGSYGLSILQMTANAVEMMGARVVFVGFQPGVASSLVDLDMDFSGMLTAVTLEDGFTLLGTSGPGQTFSKTGEDVSSETDGDPVIKVRDHG